MSVFDVTRWPGLLVFALAGLSAAGLAFVTVNLFSQAMANVAFIEEFGLVALREGALLQLGQLTLWGCLSLLLYLTFKACEVELVFRYFNWVGRVSNDKKGRKALRFRRDRDGAL